MFNLAFPSAHAFPPELCELGDCHFRDRLGIVYTPSKLIATFSATSSANLSIPSNVSRFVALDEADIPVAPFSRSRSCLVRIADVV